MEQEKPVKTAQQKMVEGTAWMTAASFISRFLGVIYIIPWMMMLGSEGSKGNVLYAAGYNIYGIFLQVSTAGVPAALSKMVASYNSKDEKQLSWALLKSSMLLMIVSGIVSGLLMHVLAPSIAASSPATNVAESTAVIRSLVPAVVILPAMSLIRGYYQGFNEMAPSAISQLIEQVLRLVYLLLMTLVVMKLLGGPVYLAVEHSTFAAFVGAVGSFAYLAYRFWKERELLMPLQTEYMAKPQHSNSRLLWEIIRESIPFVIITSGIQLAQNYDQLTFKSISLWLRDVSLEQIELEFGIFSFNANKIIMMIISIAVSMAAAAIPLLAAQYAKQQKEEVRHTVQKNVSLYSFIMFPCAMGMIVVAEPLYTIFYGADVLGTDVLVVSCYMSIILGAYTLFSAMLQAIQHHKAAIVGLALGLVVKVLWQPMMIYFAGASGPLWSSIVGFGVASVYMLVKLYFITEFSTITMAKEMTKLLIMTVAMVIVAKFVFLVASFVLSPQNRVTALVLLAVVGAVGGIVYGYLALLFKMADEVIGQKAETLRRKFHIKALGRKS